jgi:PAS domain S-box-containing protein
VAISRAPSSLVPQAQRVPSASLPDTGDRWHLLVEGVVDHAIFLLDPAARIATWNVGAERIFGFRASEVLGGHLALLYPEEDAENGRSEGDLGAALRSGRHPLDGWLVRKSGKRFWAQGSLAVIHDASGQPCGFTAVVHDGTEYRNSLEALRLSEERMRLMVEGVRDYAIFMLDPGGRIRSWNSGAERLKGYKAEEIIGKHFEIFYTNDARSIGHPQDELRIAKAEGRYEEEGWRVKKDGTHFWANVLITSIVNQKGDHIGFAKVTRDMTERREAEEMLRHSEERLRLLVESVKDYAIFMLDPDGRIASWNSGAQQIKGYRAEEVIGKYFAIFYPPELRATGQPERELEIARTQGRYEEEGWRVRKDGERFWANVVLTAVFDVEGRLCGFAKVTRDLTERRRMELEAHEAEQEAMRERIRAIEAQTAVKIRDEFISVAAHELRTPLTALQLKLQGAAHGLEPSDVDAGGPRLQKLAERVRGSLRQVGRLGELVERLLDVSRVVGQKLEMSMEQADVVVLVRQIVDDLRDAAAQAGSELRVAAPPSFVGTWDKARIEQVVINLLSNAIKYGRGKPIEIMVQPFEQRVRIVVVDHGIGIADEDVERIFARFERAVSTRHYGGLGLGLYVTRNIVEAHGGSIRVVSSLNEGSTFTVELPRNAVVEGRVALGAGST